MTNSNTTPERILPIVGTTGYYISNYGYVISTNKHKSTHNPIQLKGGISSQGYLFVRINFNGTMKTVNVHKLVVKHFLNTDFKCVNHIDGNKTNAHIDNLEPCTQKHNVNEAMKNNLNKKSNAKRAVIIYDSVDDIYYRTESLSEAAKALNVHIASIYNACMNKVRTVKGFKVSYAN